MNNSIIVAGGCLNQICPTEASSCYCTNITDIVEAYFPDSDNVSAI